MEATFDMNFLAIASFTYNSAQQLFANCFLIRVFFPGDLASKVGWFLTSRVDVPAMVIRSYFMVCAN